MKRLIKSVISRLQLTAWCEGFEIGVRIGKAMARAELVAERRARREQPEVN